MTWVEMMLDRDLAGPLVDIESAYRGAEVEQCDVLAQILALSKTTNAAGESDGLAVDLAKREDFIAGDAIADDDLVTRGCDVERRLRLDLNKELLEKAWSCGLSLDWTCQERHCE